MSVRAPVRNVGLQVFLLEDDWKKENVEFFCNEEDGIIDYKGEKKNNPQTIFDPGWFKRYHGIDEGTMRGAMSKYLCMLCLYILNEL